MCGFIGCFQQEGRPLPQEVLEPMLSAIRHRGPDDEGFHVLSFNQAKSAPHQPGARIQSGMDGGFGFARLSIQDLSAAGHQPMANADGSVVLVFNGEIYNAGKHRDILRSEGVAFRSHSDTEVILRLYERYGWDEMLTKIEGMFALAVADLRLGSLRVARDHFGIKPLYYTQLRDGTLLLASEIKAFLPHPEFVAELEAAHLPEQLMFRHTAWNRTLLRGVSQLPPGHQLEWRTSGPLSQRRYWALTDPVESTANPAHLRDLIRQAVASQMISDVPLGTQLSGGIDSSLVTLDAARASTDTRHSFSIVFDDPNVSEDAWITEAARKAGVHSHRYLFSPKHFADDFARVTWHNDAPLGNPNTMAIDMLARKARSSVKVLLTGEGCDELFAGYNRFYYTMLQQEHPRLFRAGAALCGKSLGRLWRLFGQAAQSLDHQMVTGSAYGAGSLITTLMPGSRVDDAISARLDHLASMPGKGLRKQIRYEAETYLPDLLLRQDKMTMAHGLECRVPFLDLQVAAAARALPLSALACATYGPNARMRGTKRLIKELASAEFGPKFAYRRKRGFDVPLDSFFIQPQVRQKMLDAWLPGIHKRGILEAIEVTRLWECVAGTHRSDQASNTQRKAAAEALWVAVGLEVWAGQFLDHTKATAS